MKPGNCRELVLIYLKGFAMGCADAVPGVSGGTIALITGIYERLVDALTSSSKDRILRFTESLMDLDTIELRKILYEMDVPFLMVLGTGIATAVLLVLNMVNLLLSQFPVPTYGFFFGLIAASAAVLYRDIDFSTIGRKIAALTGFSVAFLASGYGATTLGHELPVLFIAGGIAVSAMVLPGISGSLLLIMMGQYEYISGALSKFTESLITAVKTGDINSMISASPPIIVFVAGAFIGLFSVVHLVEKALKTQRMVTMAFLVSMVVGALRAPVIQVGRHLSENGFSWMQVLPEFALTAVIGGFAIVLLDSRTERL